MPIPTDEQRLERRLKSQFQKAMTQYHLIEDGDKILVALSGGKDSLFLLEMLGKRAKIQRPHFEVEAIHVRMENIAYESDTKYLEDFAQSVGVPLHGRDHIIRPYSQSSQTSLLPVLMEQT